MSKARTWAGGLLVLVLLAISLSPVLLYGSIEDYRRTIPSSGPNNGATSSYFIFHGMPSWTYPEDFYFYAVRAKRIEDRGWVDDIFQRDGAESTTPRALLQHAIMRLALATEGKPGPYSGLTFALLLASSLWLYAALALAFPDRLGVGGRVATVAVFATSPNLAAALSLVTDMSNVIDPLVWPGTKSMRLSTFTWSNGLLAATVVLSAVLAAGRPLARAGQGMIAAAVLLLSLGDVWAYAIALVVAGLAVAVEGARRLRRDGWRAGWRGQGILLTGLVISLAIYLATAWATHPDALDRGGFGAAWVGEHAFTLSPLDRWSIGFLIDSGSAGLLIFVLLGLTQPRRFPEPLLLVLLASAALVVLLAMALEKGAYNYQVHQFHSRIAGCYWLAALLCLARIGKRLGDLACRFVPGRRAGVVLQAVFVLALPTAYTSASAVRADNYVRFQVAPDAALPRHMERLGQVVSCVDRQHRIEDAATLDHELNHLLAFWTDADLYLPEGFPLHGDLSNEEIVARAARILRLFHVSPERWRAFPVNDLIAAKQQWRHSRLLAQRRAYLYWLFHFAGIRDFELRVTEIGARLAEAVEVLPRPRLILEDPVSRQLGRPDTSDYRSLSTIGPVNVWLRTDDLDASRIDALGNCASR